MWKICVFLCRLHLSNLTKNAKSFFKLKLYLPKQKKLRGWSPQARTIPTERPPPVGEVSANIIG
jgi:hypothetical protein